MVEVLCSNYDPDHKLVCDKPLGHKGPHEAKLLWGDEYLEAKDDD